MVKLLLSHFQNQITFENANWKTEKKKKYWSRIILIRDFFTEVIYYAIQNIWKEYRIA